MRKPLTDGENRPLVSTAQKTQIVQGPKLTYQGNLEVVNDFSSGNSQSHQAVDHVSSVHSQPPLTSDETQPLMMPLAVIIKPDSACKKTGYGIYVVYCFAGSLPTALQAFLGRLDIPLGDMKSWGQLFNTIGPEFKKDWWLALSSIGVGVSSEAVNGIVGMLYLADSGKKTAHLFVKPFAHRSPRFLAYLQREFDYELRDTRGRDYVTDWSAVILGIVSSIPFFRMSYDSFSFSGPIFATIFGINSFLMFNATRSVGMANLLRGWIDPNERIKFLMLKRLRWVSPEARKDGTYYKVLVDIPQNATPPEERAALSQAVIEYLIHFHEELDSGNLMVDFKRNHKKGWANYLIHDIALRAVALAGGLGILPIMMYESIKGYALLGGTSPNFKSGLSWFGSFFPAIPTGSFYYKVEANFPREAERTVRLLANGGERGLRMSQRVGYGLLAAFLLFCCAISGYSLSGTASTAVSSGSLTSWGILPASLIGFFVVQLVFISVGIVNGNVNLRMVNDKLLQADALDKIKREGVDYDAAVYLLSKGDINVEALNDDSTLALGRRGAGESLLNYFGPGYPPYAPLFKAVSSSDSDEDGFDGKLGSSDEEDNPEAHSGSQPLVRSAGFKGAGTIN